MRKMLIALLFVVGLAGPAFAQAPAPVGNWVAEEERNTTALISPNGDYFWRAPQAQLGGTWDWRPTSPSGGIFSITYLQPTYTQTFTNHVYFSVQWLDARRIMVSDPASGSRSVWVRL
jgi:hypothetical protein